MPKKPRKLRKQRAETIKITEEYLQDLAFRDLITGLTDPVEIEIAKKHGILRFTKHPDAKIDYTGMEISAGKDKVGLKRWIKKLEKRKKNGTW